MNTRLNEINKINGLKLGSYRLSLMYRNFNNYSSFMFGTLGCETMILGAENSVGHAFHGNKKLVCLSILKMKRILVEK